MLSVFCSPCRYTQGPNATASLGQEMVTLGLRGPALIVAEPHAVQLLSDTWAESLGKAAIHYRVHAFGGESTVAEVERVKVAAQRIEARVILGAGGGKALDTARAAAADLALPFVSCPTVASTDAPTSALSVIYTEQSMFQELRIFGRNPDLVLVDTRVIAEGPPRMLVAGMGDAMSTFFEARTAVETQSLNMRRGAPTQAAFALAELCYRTLLSDGVDALRAAEAHVVTPAFERVVEANTLLSGLGFESGGLAAAHSIHNGLTAAPETHELLHGEKVAFGVLVQLVLEGRPRQEREEVLTFFAEVGLPMTLADLGLDDVSPETLQRIADLATAAGESIHNEPFEVQPKMVADAILAADALGREWKQSTERYAEVF
jgi:glycerol dehydrogenase